MIRCVRPDIITRYAVSVPDMGSQARSRVADLVSECQSQAVGLLEPRGQAVQVQQAQEQRERAHHLVQRHALRQYSGACKVQRYALRQYPGRLRDYGCVRGGGRCTYKRGSK
eukprot:2364702-Rhodomonas_salina.2